MFRVLGIYNFAQITKRKVVVSCALCGQTMLKHIRTKKITIENVTAVPCTLKRFFVKGKAVNT